MFDVVAISACSGLPTAAAPRSTPPSGGVGSAGEAPEMVTELRNVLVQLRSLRPDHDPVAAAEAIGLLEEVKSAAAAVQAGQVVAFEDARRDQQRASGMRQKQVGQGIAGEVALAKRCSPNAAQHYLVFARRLVTDLPRTFAALAAGETTEWRSMLMAREVGWLGSDQRRQVDSELSGRLKKLGDRHTEAAARLIAQRLDPAGAVERASAAATDRRVTLRPAPDTMARLTALLPVAQGVAAYASLVHAADSATATGEPRSRGQFMADTLVERLTGQVHAEDVPLLVNLVMSDETLTGTGPTAQGPARLDGGEPIPAPLARAMVTRNLDAPVWLRRLYASPETGRLVAMETTRRCFTRTQREFIRLVDQTCTTPYCAAPIRHTDHVVGAEAGGPTSIANGQGLCEACNYAKQAPGWSATRAGPGGLVTITAPTGHTYRSRAPTINGAA